MRRLFFITAACLAMLLVMTVISFADEAVSYVDENGKKQSRTDYIDIISMCNDTEYGAHVLSDNHLGTAGKDTWYAVTLGDARFNRAFKCNERIEIAGDVN